jgi:hypothetical protein
MMQRDTNFKIGVGGSILEPDKSLIVMETRQTHLTIRFKMLGELTRATDYYFPLALAFYLNSNEIIRMGSCYSNQTACWK